MRDGIGRDGGGLVRHQAVVGVAALAHLDDGDLIGFAVPVQPIVALPVVGLPEASERVRPQPVSVAVPATTLKTGEPDSPPVRGGRDAARVDRAAAAALHNYFPSPK